MDEELRAEREQIEKAVLSLEQLQRTRKGGPGRPRDVSVTIPKRVVRKRGGEPPNASAPTVRNRRGGPRKGSPAPRVAGVELPVPPDPDEKPLAVAVQTGPSKGQAGMDVEKILAELKSEREQIEEALLGLEQLARGKGRGPRGRPKGPGTPPDGTPSGGTPPSATPAAAMLLPRSRCQILWAVSGRAKPRE